MGSGNRGLAGSPGEVAERGPRPNYFGLFVGVNDYQHLRPLQFAEADAVAMHEMLTDPRSGTIPEDQARLLTGDVDRRQLTSHLTWLMNDRSIGDVVFLYIAGHGVKVDQRAYLATVETDEADIRDDLTSALGMRQLRFDFFEQTEAGFVMFVLDCCYSGSLADTRAGPGEMEEDYFQRARGRVAVMACAADEAARESAATGHGIFTGHLLDALGGRAISGAGTVTLEGAIAYVNTEMTEGQRPGFVGNQFGPAVLTTPPARELRIDRVAGQTVDPPIEASADLSAPRHAIDEFEVVVNGLIARLGDTPPDVWRGGDEARERHGLRVVRDVLGASSVVVVRYAPAENGTLHPHPMWGSDGAGPSDGADLHDAMRAVDGGLQRPFVVPRSDGAFAIFVASTTQPTCHIAIVLETNTEERWTDVVIVADIPADSPLLGDPTARIIRTLFTASQRFRRIDPVTIESAILDELRRTMGILPFRTYMRRLNLFADQLRDLEAFFQPVVQLFASNPSIHGWEALARDTEGDTPSGVFAASELWGAQFMAQLDSYMLEAAVVRFHEQRSVAADQGRSQTLSVNCYPSSLVKDPFLERLREIAGRGLIPSRDLILEISEKHELPVPRGLIADTSTSSVEANFRRTIESLSAELRVNFAIDDFGVGHSSIARLLGLQLSYVKVDRELLGHEAAHITFPFIAAVVHHGRTMVPTIVAEGYEGAEGDGAQLELGDLMDLGIDYVQGFGIRHPAPTLAPLTPDERARITTHMGIRRT